MAEGGFGFTCRNREKENEKKKSLLQELKLQVITSIIMFCTSTWGFISLIFVELNEAILIILPIPQLE